MSLVYGRKPYVLINNADALLAYNLSKEEFRELGKNNFIPLIALIEYCLSAITLTIN